MAQRTLRYRGLKVKVEVPDHVVPDQLLPALTGFRWQEVNPSLLVGDPPGGTRPEPRSPQRALDFLRAPELEGDGLHPLPAAQEHLAAAKKARDEASTLAEKVANCMWYHSIELPDGTVTPGAYDHRPLVPFYGLPDDLSGLRVIDLATFDGFWAFEFERRGADVTALDLTDVSRLDWPAGAGEIMVAEQLGASTGTGFEIARDELGSKVERIECSIYDVNPKDLGTFDIVHISDVLIHLRCPLDALRAARTITDGKLILADAFDPDLYHPTRNLVAYDGGWDGLQWSVPAYSTLAQYVIDAGYQTCDVRKVFRLGNRFGDKGLWRAVIHAEV